MEESAYRFSHGFTRAQCRRGGLNRWAKVALDPGSERLLPALPGTWERSYLVVDRIFKRTVQYDVIATRHERRKVVLFDGMELPYRNYTELFDAMRREASASLIAD